MKAVEQYINFTCIVIFIMMHKVPQSLRYMDEILL